MRRKLLLGLLATILAFGAWLWMVPLGAWRSIERVPFDPAAARQVLAATEHRRPGPVATSPVAASPVAAETVTTSTPPTTAAEPVVATTLPSMAEATVEPAASPAATGKDEMDVLLILGNDEKPNDRHPGIRADTIVLLIVPQDRSASMLISIPRLLSVTSPCTGETAPINTNLDGCGEVGGLDLMGVAVEDYTGLLIDHLVLFDFQGFRTIVDRLGGLEVCVDNPVKLDAHQQAFLEPGCSTLDGKQALRWVRGRRVLEEVDREWRLLEPVGDAGRTLRQREMMRQIMSRAGEFDSPAALMSLASELSASFALDSGFGLSEAAQLAWDFRSLGERPTHDRVVESVGDISAGGELVQLPVRPFSDYLEPLGNH